MRQTTGRERMDLLREVSEEIYGAGEEWLRRWAPEGKESRKLVWQEDGTAVLSLDDEEVMVIRVEVITSVKDYVNAENKPTGFVTSKSWSEVPAGWFVRGPKAEWFEVLASNLKDGQQHVTLNVNGKKGTWPRDPEAKVSVRRGTLSAERDRALDVINGLFGPAAILADEGQFS